MNKRRLVRATQQHIEALKTSGVKWASRSPSAGKPLRRPLSVPKEEKLKDLAHRIGSCQKCSLYQSRTHIVVSDGSASADLMFIGEAPGREEDLQGVPFVGAAGQLLTKMIAAIGMRREEVYICNVLKDRPPRNRTPLPHEIEACLPFLEEQITIIAPKVICLLGSVAAKAFLGEGVSITRIRGSVRSYNDIPVVPTYHPAYLLRNPSAKRQAWVDLKLVKSLLEAS